MAGLSCLTQRRRPRDTDEARHLGWILLARHGLDAGVDVDAPGPRDTDGLAHGLGREPGSQDHAAPARRLAGERPRDRDARLAAFAPPRRAVEQEGRGLVAVQLGKVGGLADLD